MSQIPKYYLVSASALPEVFLKVAAALQNLETGKALTIGEAVRQTGISRSAFYKYRDAIRPFFDTTSSRIVTFHLILEDAPGVLSGILRSFAVSGANILTINQSIPINGVASVTISAETEGMGISIDEMMNHTKQLAGVTKIEIIGNIN